MAITETEVLLNLNTGEARQNVITTDKAFRFHDGFTESDREAGWKQVANLGSGCSQDDIDEQIAQARAIYFATFSKHKGEDNCEIF